MKKNVLSILGIAMCCSVAQAQPYSYNAASSTNLAGFYIDLGVGGTAITVANNDDANSDPLPIGFTFNYGCESFDSLILNTNGFIKLGNTPPSATNLFFNPNGNSYTGGPFNSIDPADVNIISAFNHDLEAGTGTPEFRIETSGTAPNRVCTIQFKNLRDKTTTPAIQYDNIEFQIKLFEADGTIEFVYGTWTASANAHDFKSAVVGLKTSVVTVAARKTSNTAWNAATFINGNYTGDPHNHRNNILPDVGRTYRFTPIPVAYDIAVSNIYNLTYMPKTFGAPHIIQTRLVNNIVNCDSIETYVTLSITGANTFTTTDTVKLAPSGILLHSFDEFIPTNTGSNTITVSVSADSNNVNNTLISTMVVNTNTYSYSDNTAQTRLNSGGANYQLVSKYSAPNGAKVDSIYVTTHSTATAGVGFEYGIWRNDGVNGTPGTRIYTSAAQSSILGLNKISTGGVEVSGDFYVGVAQTTTSSFGLSTQSEIPLRAETFYYSADGTSWVPYNSVPLNLKNMIDVFVSCVSPVVPSISGNLSVVKNTTEKYTITPQPNYTYMWSVNGGTITSTSAGGDTVDVLWQTTGSGSISVTAKDLIECTASNSKSVSVAAGINESALAASIKISPNPTTGVALIDLSNISTQGNLWIEITDIQGKVVYKHNPFTGKNTTIDISDLNDGIYYIRIIADDKVATKKLIKQN